MGDAADDYDEDGYGAWLLHETGECDEAECQYCQEEHWLEEDE